MRTLPRLECVLDARHYALPQRSDVAPAWVRQHVPLDWYPRAGLRSDQTRRPKDTSQREALARQVGADGDQLLAWVPTDDLPVGLTERPALEALRQLWVQHDDRGQVPGLATLRWRTSDERPPAAVRLASPYDLEARDSRQCETHGVGSQVHRTETCETDSPKLMTPGMTTPATTQDSVMGPAIQQDFAHRHLLPGSHWLDSGAVDADLLVTAETPHPLEVIGPPFGSYRRQRREGRGDDLQACVIEGEAQQARCPQGQTSVHWRSGHQVSGDPVRRLRVDGATCRGCLTRQACTSPRGAPRHLPIGLQSHHEALQTARHRQETPEFAAQSALRAGVESRLSQGTRRFDLRRSRSLGLARTHLQHLLTATAMKLVRVIAWRRGEPLGGRRRQPGHFAHTGASSVVTPDHALLRKDLPHRVKAPFTYLGS